MSLSAAARPSPVVASAVVQIARDLMRAASAEELLTTPVLVPDIGKHTTLTTLDRAIAKDLRALAAVCHQPHDRLGTEHVLLRADQARRVSPVGLARLASHSEDWAGVEFDRVVPKRLLAQRHIDDYDFYENQVAVQLVDRLRRYLGRRIRDLGKLEHHLASLNRYQKALQAPQSHWKRERLATLIGEAAATSQTQPAQVEAVLEQLGKLRTAVNLLRESPLYRRADRRAAIPFRLPRTNLLSRDRRYHRTALLWEAWAAREADESAALAENLIEFPGAYASYVAAITLRAGGVLGLQPTGASAPLSGTGLIELGSPNGLRLHVRAGPHPEIEVSAEDKPVMHVVAIPDNITASPSSAQVGEALRQ
jgi:Domain of unknown function (DUF2357)